MIESLLRRFGALLGDKSVKPVLVDDGETAPHPSPCVHLLPRSQDELVACVRLAFEEKVRVQPVGGNSAPSAFRRDPGPYLLLSTEFLDRVIEHAAEDLTVTVEAGLAIDELSDQLRPAGQKLPFVNSRGPRSTIGGHLAVGQDGPTAKAYGRLRDQILGMTVVHGDGRVTRTGGRVVKNVTGFDLAKLYVGPRGAFGIVLQTTLRLRAEERAACRIEFDFADLKDALLAGATLRARAPDLFSLQLAHAAGKSPWRIQVRLRGEEALVEALGEECFALVRGDDDRRILPDQTGAVAPTESTQWRELRAGIRPSEIAPLLNSLDSEFLSRVSFVADLETGLVRMQSDPETWNHYLIPASSFTGALAPLTPALTGDFDLIEAHAWNVLFPWTAPTRAAEAVVSRLKSNFDPSAILPKPPAY